MYIKKPGMILIIRYIKKKKREYLKIKLKFVETTKKNYKNAEDDW